MVSQTFFLLLEQKKPQRPEAQGKKQLSQAERWNYWKQKQRRLCRKRRNTCLPEKGEAVTSSRKVLLQMEARLSDTTQEMRVRVVYS